MGKDQITGKFNIRECEQTACIIKKGEKCVRGKLSLVTMESSLHIIYKIRRVLMVISFFTAQVKMYNI